MSFNCTKLESFKRIFTMIIPPGVPGAPAPRLPSYHMLHTTLLDEQDGEVQKCVRPVLDTSKETGCTIMTDGWTNIRGETLCNYLVGTKIGVAYVATDVMHGKKDASALANTWLKRVKSMDIELSGITTFVTDSAGVNVAAMEVFQKDESVKHIFWIRCVAHIMDLILEDIGGIDWVAYRIAQARLVTRFFKHHRHVREVFEAYSKKTLQLPAETRFGTNVIMMMRQVELRAELTQVVGDDRWRENVWSTSKIRKDAAEVTVCIGSPPWWEDLRALCKMLEPIMDKPRLRLRHGGRRDESIASRVHRRRGNIATDMGARVTRQDPVVVSEDEMADPSNETWTPVVGTEEETEFGGPGPLRQAQTRCTPAGAPVHSTGAGLEDGEARREPPPHTSDGGLEDGEVAPTPTCGQDGEDECPPTGHHVGLDCPPGSLPRTDELLNMDSTLAFLPDVSLLITPTLALVAPPEPGGRDDVRRDRGFDEFGGDTILHPPESGTPAVFHVGAPWAVEQGLAEEVARNHRGGPPVAAQRSLGGSLKAASGDFAAQLSDGVSSVRPPDEGPQQEPHRGSTETLEARPPGVICSDGGEGVGHDTAQPGSIDARRSIEGGIERIRSSTTHPNIVRPNAHDVGDAHTHEPRPHLMGMRDIMRPPPSRSPAADPIAHGQASQSALPTRSFYDGAAMDRRAGDIGHASACGPVDVTAGARLIGNVDGTCHDSMRAFEEQHGRPIRAKTTDVHDTRTAIARLSRARKKGTGASIPYHRRRPHPFFRYSDETKQMAAATDGRGEVDGGDRANESGRGEKRRGGTIIIHDDSSTAAEGGETTGADDPDDYDYVPRIRTADGDDGGGRRVLGLRRYPSEGSATGF
ncbi:hypothetical protein CBR_g32664 [Chara braunii]|uniref:DUF659 domain-containing protein n=1 Tax=Chara braunii TaxID=69332 RepID=A0A388LH72_CHABU|nr:hypothetical protein CBR_g32664 [Chara braunii]|eukprot:GBG81669.1 hypothetical protein CBR_g32664 [Chara braunii]